mgnify:CR=1 FL=1
MKDFFVLMKDVWDFLAISRKFCLTSLTITIFLLAAEIIYTQGTAIAPFIYTIC